MADTEKALQQIAAFWRSKHDLRVVGITGSVGKSTTKELVSEVLSQRYRTLKNLGNQNNEIGLPLTLTRLGEGHQAACWKWVSTSPRNQTPVRHRPPADGVVILSARCMLRRKNSGIIGQARLNCAGADASRMPGDIEL